MAFQSGKMFLLSRYTGLYLYDGTTWVLLRGAVEGRNLCIDADTFRITRTSSPINYYYSTVMFTGFTGGTRRMVKFTCFGFRNYSNLD